MKVYRWIGPVLAITLAMTLVIAGCTAGPTEEQDDDFTVEGYPTLHVRTDNGFIDVKTGVDGEVHVHANIRGIDRIDYEVSQDGNTITVAAQIEEGWFSVAGTDITITTPVFSNLELYTSNGSVEVDGIQGLVNIHTSNGRISLQNVIGEFNAFTSNASISFNGTMVTHGNNRLTSSNGDIDVELWAPINIRLVADTSNGNVVCEIPIRATMTEDDHLIGVIGRGDANLFIHTSNGDVTIREREVEETPTPSLTPLACKGEVEGILVIPNPPECCEGLDLIPPKAPDIVGITGICTANCGNGVCDSETESGYNCPEDCGG